MARRAARAASEWRDDHVRRRVPGLSLSTVARGAVQPFPLTAPRHHAIPSRAQRDLSPGARARRRRGLGARLSPRERDRRAARRRRGGALLSDRRRSAAGSRRPRGAAARRRRPRRARHQLPRLPQPIDAVVELAHAAGAVVLEDCALAFASAPGGRPAGSTGDWSVFCLYKSLPVPDGALLVENRGSGLDLRSGDRASGWARPWRRARADLVLGGARSRADGLFAPLAALKARAGAWLTRAGVRRWPRSRASTWTASI